MTINRVRYHRNGVGGNGFFVVDFKDHGERLVAIYTGPMDDHHRLDWRAVHVIDPKNPSRTLRGADVWGDAVCAAILAAYLDRSAFAE